MRFGMIPVREAEGAVLAHSLATKGETLKKGRTLSSTDIARLLAAGIDAVMAVRLEPGDVAEDQAARRVAAALLGPHMQAAAPFTGRANLYADARGLVAISRSGIEALNEVAEGLTVATLSPFERVSPRQMIATVKIIPFSLAESDVARAEALARSRAPMLAVHPFRTAAAGLIMTRFSETRETVLSKRARAIEGRLAALGSRTSATLTVPHETAAVATAIADLAKAGHDPIIVFAASAIVDRADVIPAALVRAGGRIERLGMPVDPGNLMLLGQIGCTDVIGAPSCAASPKLNGFDWILERRLAGLDVTSADVARMGLGGLLKEIATRPQPRDGADEAITEDRHAPRIEAVVLAAGRSTRYGAPNKLIADLDGQPLVGHAVAAARGSRVSSVVVVTGHDPAAVAKALDGQPVRFVANPDYRLGLSTSLRAGIAAVSASADGAIVCLGDMPRITAGHIDRLIAAFAPKEGRSIVVPTHEGKRGNPVLFGRQHFAELIEDVAGDTGARHVIGRHGDEVVEVDLGTDAIFADVDTPAALAAIARRD